MSHPRLTIRHGTPADYAATRQMVDDAFRPEDVVTFLDALRGDGCIMQEWVAEEAGDLVGHIIFSRVWLVEPDGQRHDAAILTPLAVRPDRQRTGIGCILTQHALTELEARGETLFVVLGHPDYYPRLGFSAQAAQCIQSPWPNEPAFMARGALIPSSRLEMPSVIAEAH